MTTNVNNNELAIVGRYLESIAKGKKLSLRDINKTTNLSINSIKVVFSGAAGNTKTYEIVSQALGTTFCQAVITAHSSAKTGGSDKTTSNDIAADDTVIEFVNGSDSK